MRPSHPPIPSSSAAAAAAVTATTTTWVCTIHYSLPPHATLPHVYICICTHKARAGYAGGGEEGSGGRKVREALAWAV